MDAQWIIAIGTVILAIIALFQDFVRAWIMTPELEVATGSCTPYCKRLLFIRKDDSSIRADGYALRIRVRNIRPQFRIKTRAYQVEVFALRLLKKHTDGSYQPVPEFEPSNLIWSNSFIAFADISPEMERYCFIGRVLDPKARHNFPEFDVETYNMNETCMRIDTDIARNTKEHIIPPGTYRLECLIGAANTKAFKKTFEISISGDWFDDEIKMYDRGVAIQTV